MLLNLKDLVVENEKRLDVKRFFVDAGEEEYITIKKLEPVDKLKLKFMQNSLWQNEYFKKAFDEKKQPDEVMKELSENQKDEELKSWAELNERIIKTHIDLSIVQDEKHTLFYEVDGEKKYFKVDYEFLQKLNNQKLIDYIYSEAKAWNSDFFS
jgi:hypothetical protein